MTQPIDEAFVEIKPDLDDFTRDLKRKLDAAFRTLRRDVDDTATQISRSFRGAADDTERYLKSIGSTLTKEAVAQRRSWQQVGDSIGGGVQTGARIAGRAVDNLADSATGNLRRIRRETREVAQQIAAVAGANALARLGDVLGKVGSSIGGGLLTALSGLGQFASSISVTAVAVTALIVLLVNLVAVVVTLSAAVSSLLALTALVPAGLAAIAALVAPLIIAFKGLAAAFEAAFERDPEKFAEALKKLSPAARSLAMVLRGFLPVFDRIRDAVQAAFLNPVVGVLKPTLTRLLPVFEKGFVAVAAAAGRFTAHLLTLLSSPEFAAFFSQLFPAVAAMVDKLAPVTGRLLASLVRLAGATLPVIDRLVVAFGDLILRFAGFLDRVVANGQLEGWLTEAFAVVQGITGLLGASVSLIAALFSTENRETGRQLLDDITRFTQRIADFFRSEEGKQFLRDLARLAREFILALELALPTIKKLAQAMFEVAHFVNQAAIGVSLLNQLLDGSIRRASTLGQLLGIAAAKLAQIGAAAVPQGSGPKPKVPTPLQHGGAAKAGRLHLVGEDGPEFFTPSRSGVVATLNQIRDLFAGATRDAAGRGATVTVNNYITVEAGGSIPEAQARATGRAVGAGIADTLTRRDIRTAVRTL